MFNLFSSTRSGGGFPIFDHAFLPPVAGVIRVRIRDPFLSERRWAEDLVKGAVEGGGGRGRVRVAEVGGGDGGVIREMQFAGGIQGQDSGWRSNGSDGSSGGGGGGVKF